jgi:uncharacterized protein YlxW (UPF0749 family)
MPEKVSKTNTELLVEISKSLSSLHKKQDTLIKNLDNLQKELTDFKNTMPTRKSGWFNDYWEMKT